MKPFEIPCPKCKSTGPYCRDLIRGDLFPLGIWHKWRITLAEYIGKLEAA